MASMQPIIFSIFLKSIFDSRDLFINAYVNVLVPDVAYLKFCGLHATIEQYIYIV